MTNDLADILAEATYHNQNIPVVKTTAAGVRRIMEAGVFNRICPPSFWAVMHPCSKKIIAKGKGFASVEEAAEACAAWLVGHGYSLY